MRKVGCLSSLLEACTSRNDPSSTASSELSLHEALLRKFANLVPEAKTSMAGIDCRVRHTGTFTRDDIILLAACKRNKDTVREVQGLVSLLLHIIQCISLSLSFVLIISIEIDSHAQMYLGSAQDDS